MEEIKRNYARARQNDVNVRYVVVPDLTIHGYAEVSEEERHSLWQKAVLEGVQKLLKRIPHDAEVRIQIGQTKVSELSYGFDPAPDIVGDININARWIEEEKHE